MTKQAPAPYDGTAIFKPRPTPKQWDGGNAEGYSALYTAASRRISAPDMILPEQAAKRMKITVPEYEALAEKGEALLIRLGKRNVIPGWTIRADGSVDALKLDIAREFMLESRRIYGFQFLDYLDFMTKTKADISHAVHPDTLSMMFYTAGLKDFDCKLTVNATMNQLADLYGAEKIYRTALFKKLDEVLTHGGWDASGGLSRHFRDKYKIPGLTLYEQRTGSRPPAPDVA
jgi:hypothetical protein